MTNFLRSNYTITITPEEGNNNLVTITTSDPTTGGEEGVSFQLHQDAGVEEFLFPLRDCFRALFRHALLKAGDSIGAAKIPHTVLAMEEEDFTEAYEVAYHGTD